MIVHQHNPDEPVLSNTIQRLMGHRLGQAQADPSLLPAMRRGMAQLAVRDADQQLRELLQHQLS